MSSSAAFSAKEAAQNYLYLFVEIIERTNFVGRVLDGGLNLPEVLASEICFLNLRKICELFALGSLYLHGDLSGAKSLEKEWNAEQIFKKLERLHSKFFPRPASYREEGGNRHIEELKASPFLTLDEMKKLYIQCGEELHRGKIKTLDLSGPLGGKADLLKVAPWFKKIIPLVNSHLIDRADDKGHYFFDARDANGKSFGLVVEHTPSGEAVLHPITMAVRK